MAFEMGRHLIGYEVQKVLAAVDWFAPRARATPPVGVIGYGEGGLLALYAGGARRRGSTPCGVSGYFGPREDVWRGADLPQRLGPAAASSATPSWRA